MVIKYGHTFFDDVTGDVWEEDDEPSEDLGANRAATRNGHVYNAEEAAYWNEQERRKWDLVDKLLAQAYGKD